MKNGQLKNSRLEFIKEQSKSTRNQTLDILGQTPFELWDETPPVIESNISWQVGHLIVSQYYHSIAVIAKPNLEIFKKVPLKDYIPIFSMLTKSTTNDLKPEPQKLLSDLEIVNNYALDVLDQMIDENLDDPLEPTRMPHPIANTKYEALTWSFRHEMWHLGQISTLKRIIGNPTKW